NSGDNVLSGLAGDDTLNGMLGNDLLLGGDGEDLLHVSIGNYTLTGGAGSDTFDVSGFVGFDVIITDFNGLPGGDVIGRHGMLTNFAPGVSNIADYLQTVTVDGSTTIRADVDGPGPVFTFVDWCLLQGVSTDVAGLVANGSILGVGN